MRPSWTFPTVLINLCVGVSQGIGITSFFLAFFFFLQELYSQLKAKEETYNQLLDKGRLMLLSRDDSGSGSKTEQSVALLEQKWHVVSSKMEERKVSPQNTVCDY